MSDIFDEKKDMLSTNSIVEKIKRGYEYNAMAGRSTQPGISERARQVSLYNKWPGDEFVRQIVLDAARVIVKHDLNPGHIKW